VLRRGLLADQQYDLGCGQPCAVPYADPDTYARTERRAVSVAYRGTYAQPRAERRAYADTTTYGGTSHA
jgi:hypothetical protein